MSPTDTHGPQKSQFRAYVLLIALYNCAVAMILFSAKRSGRLAERPQAGDLLLAGLATQRLSRLLTKDRVTSALRAPFTTYEGDGGPGEVEERPRGQGIRRAVGELLVCPFCLAQWIATAFASGLLFAPRVTRFVASVLSTVALADLLQFLYKGTEKTTIEG